MKIENDKLHVSNMHVSILDSMIDGIRVIDRNNIILHINESMKKIVGSKTIGMECYRGLGQKEKCNLCITEKTIATGKNYRKEEIINDRIFDVISSPIYDDDDKIVGVLEVFRDTTKEKELEKSIVEKNQAMTSDIEFARRMQKNMLPSKGMYGGLKINYEYHPSEILSGDIFDVFTMDKEKIGIYICDVVGHGVTASMISMYVRQTMKSICKTYNEINKIMQELHKTFIALNFDDEKYFSIFVCIFDIKTKMLQYINAGHNCMPIFMRKNNIRNLEAKGYPICNIFDTVNYEVFNLKLEKKDKIILYTDGITEIKNFKREEFGEKRLKNIIKKSSKKSSDISGEVLKEINKFKGIQKDDITILEIEVT